MAGVCFKWMLMGILLRKPSFDRRGEKGEEVEHVSL
jgi:hypothetical protein